MSPKDLFNSFVMPSGGFRFEGRDFRRMCGPQVYMFLLRDEVLYVGMSGAGMSRAGQRNHRQAARARDVCDEVLLWPTYDIDSARKMEALMVKSLLPRFNLRMKPKNTTAIPPQAESERQRLWRTDRRAFIARYIHQRPLSVELSVVGSH